MSDFDQLMHDIEQEAIAEGPEAVAELPLARESLPHRRAAAGSAPPPWAHPAPAERALRYPAGRHQPHRARRDPAHHRHRQTPRRRARRRLRLLRNRHRRQSHSSRAGLRQSGVASWPTTAQSSGRRRPGTRSRVATRSRRAARTVTPRRSRSAGAAFPIIPTSRASSCACGRIASTSLCAGSVHAHRWQRAPSGSCRSLAGREDQP